MIRTNRLPGERRADDILDDHLAQRFGVGLEQVLLDGIEDRVTPAVAGVVEIAVRSASRSPHSDGGVTEFFEGTLTLEGLSYEFRCEAYSIPCAYVHRFLTNLWQFEPVEWSTSIRPALPGHG